MHCCKASHAAERRLTCLHRPAELSQSGRTLVSGRGSFCMHSKSAAKQPHSKKAEYPISDTSRETAFSADPVWEDRCIRYTADPCASADSPGDTLPREKKP